ncbi:Nascent polypeptide-associated complex subunit beta [Dimargaris cristalligena]|uniref:Nascent polypeptide-associated complex subunit beta n=1 Tax=Dimargaris cristalligena TaxID=215637 RepID=A0A4V1J5L5_9FUNG|nr:Nascent polypeptide-associated complex subunit beta [Dimargaris cristalligena]RKP39479.1 NAC domain-containing protein [Dimargaris cristalligena]|eukprot:RKP39479.1 NAC domain-containing protein [Dimargaris cristalligena]
MNADKLSKLQSQARIGGKGTPRRKMKRTTKSTYVEDKKLTPVLKKLNVSPVSNIEEVNMFREDGKIIHFKAPHVQSSVDANTFVISGKAQEKEMAELIPNILAQMGPDSMASLKKLAEAYQQAQGTAGAEGEEDIPDLVGDFDENADAEVEAVAETEEAAPAAEAAAPKEE